MCVNKISVWETWHPRNRICASLGASFTVMWLMKFFHYNAHQSSSISGSLFLSVSLLIGPLLGEVLWIHACPYVHLPLPMQVNLWKSVQNFCPEILHSDKNLETEKSGRTGFSRKILVCPKIGKKRPWNGLKTDFRSPLYTKAPDPP